MPEEKKVIELRILDNDFTVRGSESETYIKEIAAFVDDELNKVKERSPFTNHIRIALLGCMNITEMLFDAKKEVVTAEEKQDEEKLKAQEIKVEVDKANDEINLLKQDKLELVEKKEELEKELEEKNELLNQYREHLKQAKAESEESRKQILNLQNQLFENQIELVKASKNAELSNQTQDM